MQIYVVVKMALQYLGEYTLGAVEKAFSDKAKAEEYMKSLPVVWEETVQGIPFRCERAVHVVEVED